MALLAEIQRRAKELHARTVDLRRDLHAHPELAFEEVRTSQVVQRRLTELGISFQSGVAQTGVVGLIEGTAGDGPTIALRADMDALPILEANDVPYRSTHTGKMHACGHDAHTASLLGTAAILQDLRHHLRGRVKLVFQPSEEKLPGGANIMIQEGVLRNPAVQTIVGQHVQPHLPAGIIGIRGGTYMASTDEIYMTIRGKGGHGAQPHTTIDPILISAHVITGLQQVISRNNDPRRPSVLTIGHIIGQGATNIIPEHVYLEGTFRAFDEQWREQAHGLIRRIARGIVEAMGGTLELDIQRGYPVLHNDEALTSEVRQYIEAYVGRDRIVDLDLWMAAEDFAFYTHQVPGCFYRIGTGNAERGITHGLHTPRFDIDESALETSTGLMAWIAARQLGAA